MVLSERWNLLLRRLPWLFTAMVIYHLAWAVGLYTAFRSLTLPLVKRMPDSGFQSLEFQVLFAEWQFRLYKTDMMGPAIAFVAGLLLLRMMFTPFINAGLYYTFHLAGEPGHDFQRKPFSPFSFRQLKTFLIGLGRVGKPFWLIHLLQWALALLPLWLAMHRIGGLEAVITGAVQLRTITLLSPYLFDLFDDFTAPDHVYPICCRNPKPPYRNGSLLCSPSHQNHRHQPDAVRTACDSVFVTQSDLYCFCRVLRDRILYRFVRSARIFQNVGNFCTVSVLSFIVLIIKNLLNMN